jgi:hypothetical protein
MPGLATKEIQEGFQKHFKTNKTFSCLPIEVLTRKYNFDIVLFDEFLHKEHEYSEKKHGSISNFVLKKFGQEAHNFLINLLNQEADDSYENPRASH